MSTSSGTSPSTTSRSWITCFRSAPWRSRPAA
jgi:hypothetical protein